MTSVSTPRFTVFSETGPESYAAIADEGDPRLHAYIDDAQFKRSFDFAEQQVPDGRLTPSGRPIRIALSDHVPGRGAGAYEANDDMIHVARRFHGSTSDFPRILDHELGHAVFQARLGRLVSHTGSLETRAIHEWAAYTHEAIARRSWPGEVSHPLISLAPQLAGSPTTMDGLTVQRKLFGLIGREPSPHRASHVLTSIGLTLQRDLERAVGQGSWDLLEDFQRRTLSHLAYANTPVRSFNQVADAMSKASTEIGNPRAASAVARAIAAAHL